MVTSAEVSYGLRAAHFDMFSEAFPTPLNSVRWASCLKVVDEDEQQNALRAVPKQRGPIVKLGKP